MSSSSPPHKRGGASAGPVPPAPTSAAAAAAAAPSAGGGLAKRHGPASAAAAAAAGPVPELGALRALLCDNPEAFQVPAFIDGLVRPLLDQPDAAAGKGCKASSSAAAAAAAAAKPSGGGGGGGGMEFGFDPAALTELFSATLERLGVLGKEVDGRIEALQEEGRRLAPARRKELDRHHRQLQEVHGTIEDIEAHFRKVGLTAVRIGQSLSQTEAQRQKAAHAQQLLEYFLAFDTLCYESMLKDAEAERIEMLSNDTLAPLTEEANFQAAAAMLSDLNVVCEDLNAPHLDNAVRCIRVFGERLEKRLLDRFEEAAMAESSGPSGLLLASSAAAAGGGGDEGGPDVATMRECAHALLRFGDAVKLYNTYIYTIVAKQVQAQNASSAARAAAAAASASASSSKARPKSLRRGGLSSSDDGDEDEEEEAGGGGVDSEAAAMEMRDALSEFFGLISALCQRAFTLIRQVFPPSASLKVTRMLIDRMVNDPAFGIQVRVAQVLEEEERQGTVVSVSDSLDMLLMVHDKTHALANDLIDHCLEAERSYLEATRGNNGGGSSSSSTGGRGGGEDDDDTIDEEEGPAAAGAAPAAAGGRGKPGAAGGSGVGAGGSSRSQEALSSYVKIQFAELFVGQRDSYLEKEVSLLRLRLVDTLAAQAGEDCPGLTDGTGGKGGSSAVARRGLIEKMRAVGQEPPDLPALRHERIEGYDQMLQAWLRKEVLHAALEHVREAVGRNAKMFRHDGERADNVLEMMSVLHKFLGTSVLLPSLSAASNLVQSPLAGAPPPSFYAVLQAVHLWVDAYKAFFGDVALPEVRAKTTTQTVLLEGCRKLLQRVERAGAKTVERGLEALMRAADRLHREMVSKSDYLPKDNTVTELQATRACLALRDLLTTHVDLLRRHLPPKDVRVIVSALALRVRELLMGRLKQLRINTSGALVLMQDVEIIYGCFALPPLPLAPTADGPGASASGGAKPSGGGGGGGDSGNAAALDDESTAGKVNAPEVKKAFDELKEVVGLFIVPPENLKGLMEHGFLAEQDRNDLFIFVSNRADFRVHGFMAPWVKATFGADVRDVASPGPEDAATGSGGSPYSGNAGRQPAAGSRGASPVAAAPEGGGGRSSPASRLGFGK